MISIRWWKKKYYNNWFQFTDLPRRISALKWVSCTMAIVGVVMVLVAHGHYTIDVLIAYYITTRLFWTYHTLTNNAYLIKVSHNLLTSISEYKIITKISPDPFSPNSNQSDALFIYLFVCFILFCTACWFK